MSLPVADWPAVTATNCAGDAADNAAAAGAEYSPELETAPIWLLLLPAELETLQVTAVLLAPLTVALNCWVAPYATVELAGEMVTLTFDGGGFVEPVLGLGLTPLLQPAAANARRTAPVSQSLPIHLIALPFPWRNLTPT